MNIVLFDGICNLCEASVQFIIKHDKKGYFHFASQNSALGKKLLKKYELERLDTIVLISKNRAYIYSDCALEIAKELEGKWKFLYLFRFVPKTLRDAVYKLVAKYRYRVFGKKDSCMILSKEREKRFL